MQVHIQLIQLIVAYTLAGAFVFTCLSLLGWVRFASQAQQRKLFSVLIVQLCVVAVGAFSNLLKFNPSKVQKAILRDRMNLPGSMARESNFQNSDFARGNFAQNMFDQSIFHGSHFVECDFSGSTFGSSLFRDARFGAADFSGADLSKIKVDSKTLLPPSDK